VVLNTTINWSGKRELLAMQRLNRPKEKVQKDKQRSTKHTHKTKDRVKQRQLKTRGTQLLRECRHFLW
jgi:hypothetical protein